MQQQSLIFKTLVMLMIYVGLKFFGGAASQLLYPIIWLVAFLHEMGHAFGAIISGGQVLNFQVAIDGSGLTTTQGGSTALVIMGGYIGSAIFGNALLYIGALKRHLAQMTLYVLAILMLFASFWWFTTFESSGLLVFYALVLMWVANRTNWDQNLVMFFGLASVVYIIQDFQVGPSSDLKAYESQIGFFSAQVWMYFWLLIVVLFTFWNLQLIFKRVRFNWSGAANQRPSAQRRKQWF